MGDKTAKRKAAERQGLSASATVGGLEGGGERRHAKVAPPEVMRLGGENVAVVLPTSVFDVKASLPTTQWTAGKKSQSPRSGPRHGQQQRGEEGDTAPLQVLLLQEDLHGWDAEDGGDDTASNFPILAPRAATDDSLYVPPPEPEPEPEQRSAEPEAEPEVEAEAALDEPSEQPQVKVEGTAEAEAEAEAEEQQELGAEGQTADDGEAEAEGQTDVDEGAVEEAREEQRQEEGAAVDSATAVMAPHPPVQPTSMNIGMGHDHVHPRERKKRRGGFFNPNSGSRYACSWRLPAAFSCVDESPVVCCGQ